MAQFDEEFKIVCQQVKLPLERIEKAYQAVVNYFGENWFNKKGKNPKIIYNILEMVLLGESLLATEAIKSPSKLIKKLVKPIDQDDHLSGLSEAQVIYKLLNIGLSNIQYEPRIKWFKKRPDVAHDFNSETIQYEITRPKLSAFDREMWHKKQTDLSNKLADIMKLGGSLDVYLFEEEIKNTNIDKIVDEGSKFLQLNRAESELLIPGIAYLVFDPTGNIQLEGHKTSYPEVRADGSIGALLVDCKYDRSFLYEKKLHFKKPLTRVARVSSIKEDGGATKVVIVRVARPSEDKRITQKIIGKATQLSDKHPSIVVIEMGGTSAKLGYWLQLTKELFDSGIYKTPSAVWFRSLHLGTQEFGWREAIIINSYADKKVGEAFIKTIIPTGQIIKEIDPNFH